MKGTPLFLSFIGKDDGWLRIAIFEKIFNTCGRIHFGKDIIEEGCRIHFAKDVLFEIDGI